MRETEPGKIELPEIPGFLLCHITQGSRFFFDFSAHPIFPDVKDIR
jgi:hypothetical protein